MSFIFPVKGNVFCQGLLLYGGAFFVGAFHSTYYVDLRLQRGGIAARMPDTVVPVPEASTR